MTDGPWSPTIIEDGKSGMRLHRPARKWPERFADAMALPEKLINVVRNHRCTCDWGPADATLEDRCRRCHPQMEGAQRYSASHAFVLDPAVMDRTHGESRKLEPDCMESVLHADGAESRQ
jgi:hypothetical protein